MQNVYASRVKALQELMKAANLNAFVVLTADIHFSEYLPECFAHRAFVSGFTGSAGTLVVLENAAYLFTDGRYWLQAQGELKGSGIVLEKQSREHSFVNFLSKTLMKGVCVGINPEHLSISAAKELKKAFKNKKIKLKFKDLVSEIFTPRPPLPSAEIFAHKASFCGASVAEKLREIRAKMSEKKASHHFISTLDDIAYITNLRGLELPFTPVFLSFLLIDKHSATLFVNSRKVPPRLALRLKKQGVNLKNYESVWQILGTLKNAKVLVEPSKTSVFAAKVLKKNKNKLIKAPNPSTLMKACKNLKEIKHIKNAMIADGVALCEFFAHFESAVKRGERLSELDIDAKLTALRAKAPLYLCNSFATIAGFNANSALPHYQAMPQKFSQIQGSGLLLIDSGAQYQNGTTDITRVLGVGRVSKEQKRDYTLVLKALITLSRAVFPVNTALPLLDSLARANLWAHGLEYMHGTGHGVGYFLGVHEAPVSISHFSALNAQNKAREGMISSIEPGIYREGKWGVRLENLAVLTKANTKERGFGEFLRFETLTLCPFERSLIDFALLDSAEKSWLASYHKKVFRALAPHLKGTALSWLKRKTKVDDKKSAKIP